MNSYSNYPPCFNLIIDIKDFWPTIELKLVQHSRYIPADNLMYYVAFNRWLDNPEYSLAREQTLPEMIYEELAFYPEFQTDSMEQTYYLTAHKADEIAMDCEILYQHLENHLGSGIPDHFIMNYILDEVKVLPRTREMVLCLSGFMKW